MTRKIETPEAALWWLAEIEKDCISCNGSGSEPTGTEYGGQSELVACSICGGSGKRPVLPDLREPCPWADLHDEYDQGKAHSTYNRANCPFSWKVGWHRECPGWLPKQGLDVLHLAMNKAGWNLTLLWRVPHNEHPDEELREVTFWEANGKYGTSMDDYIAAAKAMRYAGYGGGDALQNVSP